MKVMTMAALVMACALCADAKPKPLKVYILAGQSNMTGMAKDSTLEHIKMFPDTAKEFKALFDADGKPVVLDDVYVSQWLGKDNGKLAPGFGGGKGGMLGPEYAFGIYMHKKLNEPILIIKTALGGKSLYYDFRPPSADEWTPPPGHPDLVQEVHAKLPLPEKLDLPADYMPPEDLVPRRPGRFGKFMGLRPMRGVAIGKVNGIYPIYLTRGPDQEFPGNPFQEGDLIIGVDGFGLREDAIEHWRDAFHGSKGRGDWMITITRWRQGKIETFDFDIAQSLEGGRASIEQVVTAEEKENAENKGLFYRQMMDHVKDVLGDIKRVYPDYDAKAGYELAGFVWLQGWNDMINSGVYPNRDKPRGYEQYTWLLEHLIRDIRQDLNAPDMLCVIGVLGVGGIEDPPVSNLGYFQQAMAAPANNPEFKGTVAAVRTGKYWDHQLEKLDSRSHKIKGKKADLQYKDGLEGEALERAYAEYRARHITPREEEILKNGVSNGGFHYLGSAKIMCGIGKGFAEAMLKLEDKAEK